MISSFLPDILVFLHIKADKHIFNFYFEFFHSPRYIIIQDLSLSLASNFIKYFLFDFISKLPLLIYLSSLSGLKTPNQKTESYRQPTRIHHMGRGGYN
ncbi:hypothetical protein I7I48_09988 [Histoplasma ohiense]|nr:hypothetical protein I7I48_09988 [Histoplasma ohiense (nom. inval.)]